MDTVSNLEKKEILNLEEVSDYTGFSKQTLYNLVHRKEIPHYKPTGGKLFFLKAELLLFLQKNRVASNEEISRKATKHSLTT